MMHRRLRGIVEGLRLRLVDDEARHRADIDDRARALLQHLLAEGAAAPEQAVDIDIHMEAPVLVGGVLGADVALGDAGIVDQNVDAAVRLHDVGGHRIDIASSW